MKITLLSDDAIRLEPTPGALTIEADSAEMSYSPFHMLASALASCTFSVMYSWATHRKISADDLTIEVQWIFADDPHQVSWRARSAHETQMSRGRGQHRHRIRSTRTEGEQMAGIDFGTQRTAFGGARLAVWLGAMLPKCANYGLAWIMAVRLT